MSGSSGIISQLFRTDEPLWGIIKSYMKDFFNNAATNLGSEDFISCVGFSNGATTRMNKVNRAEASKFADLWSPRNGGTYLASALTSARQIAATTQ